MSSVMRSHLHINQLFKGLTMTRYIFTRRHALRAAILHAAGALALIAGAVALMLAYFDVLTKG